MLSGFSGDVDKVHASRTQKAAEQSMNFDAWKARQAEGNTVSSDQIGWGAVSGSYGAGSIGSDPMGMAMMGMLGDTKEQRAAIAENAGFFDRSNSSSGAGSMGGAMKAQTDTGGALAPDTVTSAYKGEFNFGEAQGFLMSAYLARKGRETPEVFGADGSITNIPAAAERHFEDGKGAWDRNFANGPIGSGDGGSRGKFQAPAGMIIPERK